MRQVDENLDALAYNVMTLVAANVDYESDTTGVMLLRRMIKTLGKRRSGRLFSTRRHGHVGSIAIVSGAEPLAD